MHPVRSFGGFDCKNLILFDFPPCKVRLRMTASRGRVRLSGQIGEASVHRIRFAFHKTVSDRFRTFRSTIRKLCKVPHNNARGVLCVKQSSLNWLYGVTLADFSPNAELEAAVRQRRRRRRRQQQQQQMSFAKKYTHRGPSLR
jgi:hypothetical protein